MEALDDQRFWRIVAVAIGLPAGSLLLPAVAGEAVCGLMVIGAVVLVARRRAWTLASVRVLSIGCVLLGIGPFVSVIHEVVFGESSFSSGDLVSLSGYVVCIAGLQRLVRIRTVERQLTVVIDALSITAWISLVMAFTTIDTVLSEFSGPERIPALAYLPFTLVLVFMLLRLSLGAGERSPAIALLAAAVSSAGLSEILFLEAATGSDLARRVAVVLATVAIVLFAAAFVHPTAETLETPRPPVLTRSSRLLAFLLGTSLVATILIATMVPLWTYERMLLVAIGLLTAFRSVLIVTERDVWLSLQQVISDVSAELADLDDPDDIRGVGVAAAERILGRKNVRFVELESDERVNADLDAPDPAGAGINEIDGDVWRALHEGRTQRREWLAGSTRSRWASRLVVPIDGGPGGRSVLVVEVSPVLSTTEIFHLELLGAAVGAATSSAAGRQLQLAERSDRRFRSLVQDSNDVVMLVDRETFAAKLVSPTVERLLGYTEEECLGAHPLQFVMLEDGGHLLTSLESAVDAEHATDLRLNHKDGSVRWFAATVRSLDEDDELDGLIVSLTDIHDRKMAELQLGTSERRYRGLIETSRDIFAVIDEDLAITFVSPNVENLLLLTPAELIGTDITSLVSSSSAEAMADLIAIPREDIDGRSVELEVVNGQGETRWYEVSLAHDVGEGNDLVVTARDVHARREMEHSMRQATLHDSLTGLYNRPALQFELHQALQGLRTGQSIAVIHLDVRDFKVANESLGFDAGDQLLIAIGARIRSGLRGSDVLARFGADSFGVLTAVENVAEARIAAERLRAMFDEPLDTGRRPWSVALSIGISITASRRTAAVGMLEEAAIAVQQAKVEGGDVVVFESWMREVADERFVLESDLLPGLRAGEFHVVYQPLLGLSTQRVRSVEALLRWNHPERGPVSPNSFIPVAERSGAIVELGRWVLAESCRQLRHWHDLLPDGAGLGVSVNMSVRQLADESEFARLKEIILASGVDPQSLTLELTESLVISEVPTMRRGIEDLRSMGIRIAVDDFGSGTAGLNHLRDVPFDILKIDKSYVDPLGVKPDAYQLLSSMVELAHSMGAIVVAEGIETSEQAMLLRQMGCDVGQGFYLGRPMDPNRLDEWFAKGRSGATASQIAALPRG